VTLFELYAQIHASSSRFCSSLTNFQTNHSNRSPDTSSQLNTALNEFAGSLLITSQYISTFSEALSSMNKKARKLAKYLRKVRRERIRKEVHHLKFRTIT
jgi:hypothetical protein